MEGREYPLRPITIGYDWVFDWTLYVPPAGVSPVELFPSPALFPSPTLFPGSVPGALSIDVTTWAGSLHVWRTRAAVAPTISPVVLVVDGPGGRMRAQLASTQTAGLVAGRYTYTLQLVDNGGASFPPGVPFDVLYGPAEVRVG